MSKMLFTLFYLLITNWELRSGECHQEISRNDVVNVMDYGAVGDGISDNSQAFLKTWAAACGSASVDQSMLVPNTTFLVNPVTFEGPCNPSTISILVSGNIIAPEFKSWDGYDASRWIVFSKVQGLKITGQGMFDGRGWSWWQSVRDANQRPIGTTFKHCDNLQLQGFTHVNSGSLHISIVYSNQVFISKLRIFAPESSPNTDGIDVGYSSNVSIRHIDIATGDDCIAIGGGSSYINIRGVRCGPGHGISIGSLGKNGRSDKVEQVRVKNCTFVGTSNGVRIKTWQGGSGYAEQISFQKIRLRNVTNPIIIDQFYCPSNNCRNQKRIMIHERQGPKDSILKVPPPAPGDPSPYTNSLTSAFP
ncbi:hypothetical protein HS088_TW12G00393 [Tripterygium wilfordii]|uniref:Polygalacturonase n=1 Tax=Tripterygium wilfordii TaxID=458696 RepID=A0A7J7CYL0_TRIWF|nr:hypothetical protein HS088_TW12G00393 [Tripterygium wilfordii]